MPAIRYWKPGREYVTVRPGCTWYAEDSDAINVAVWVLGYWGSNSPEALVTGTWDEDAHQLWIMRIPKDAVYQGQYADPHDPWFMWEDAISELSNKPHRALSTGLNYGTVVSRTPIMDIPGVKLTDIGIIWFTTPTDRRAWRQHQQATLRAWERRMATRRRERAGRRWKDDRDASWRGHGRQWPQPPRKYNVIDQAR